MTVISSEENRHTQDKAYEDFNDYIAYINPDRRNILYETCGYQLAPIPDSNGSNPTPSTGNSANDIVVESHQSHYNAKHSVNNPSPAVVPQGIQVKGQAKDDQGCNCCVGIEVMESQRCQAKLHAQQMKKQNKTLQRENCNLQEYNDRVRPENEKLSIRLQTLRDLIYRIESRVIVYSDYIDEVKEALSEGKWSTARSLLDLAPTPWYYFDVHGDPPAGGNPPRYHHAFVPSHTVRMFWDSEECLWREDEHSTQQIDAKDLQRFEDF